MKKFWVVFFVIIAMVLLTFAAGNGEQKASLEGILKSKPGPELVEQEKAEGQKKQGNAEIVIKNRGHLYLDFYVDGRKECGAAPKRSCTVETAIGSHALEAKTEEGELISKKTAKYSDDRIQYVWEVIY